MKATRVQKVMGALSGALLTLSLGSALPASAIDIPPTHQPPAHGKLLGTQRVSASDVETSMKAVKSAGKVCGEIAKKVPNKGWAKATSMACDIDEKGSKEVIQDAYDSHCGMRVEIYDGSGNTSYNSTYSKYIKDCSIN